MSFAVRAEVYIPDTVYDFAPSDTVGWVTLPARWSDGINVRVGYTSETASSATSGTASLTVRDNRDGTWTATNPTSTFYDRFGVGTALRVLLDQILDSFARTSSSSWGSVPATSPTGALTWLTYGASSAASDWNVGSGVATMSIDAANEARVSWLDVTMRDPTVSVDFSFPTPTGAGISVSCMARVALNAGVPEGIRARLTVAPGPSATLVLLTAAGVQVGATAVPNVAGSSGRLTLSVEGQTVRAKAWDANTPEPQGWDLVVSDPTLTAGSPAAGGVGVRAAVNTSNTNTKPVVVTFDDFAVTYQRFHGTISDPNQTAGTSADDTTMRVDAAGVIQAQALHNTGGYSPIRRAISLGIEPSGYWPMEDRSGATELASALPGATAMAYAGGATSTVSLAGDDTITGSEPLPTFTGPLAAYFVARMFPGGQNIAGDFLTYIVIRTPSGGLPVANQILTVWTATEANTLSQFMIELQTTGEVRLRLRDQFGADVLATSLSTTFAMNGKTCLVGMRLTQSGANVNWSAFRYIPGSHTPQTISGTQASRTFGAVTKIAVGLGGDLGGATIGHAAIYGTGASAAVTGNILDAISGHNGETAGNRLARLLEEEFAAFAYRGDLDDTTVMGVQPSGTGDTLIKQCVTADMGYFAEARGGGEFFYRTRTGMYHQADPLVLDYGRDSTANELVTPFAVTGNDQLVINDVTAKRPDGGSYRAALEDGKRSIAAIGTRDEEVDVYVATDAQLDSAAWWRVALGTVPDLRAAVLTVAAHRIPDRVDDLAATFIGRRVQLSNAPAWAHPDRLDDPRELIVVGVSERIDQFEWTLAFVCVPGELYDVPLVLDNIGDPGGCKVNTSDSEVAADATSSATSLSVASTWLWTTSAGQMPIPIEIGGEAIDVTAISGASSPQTFTVTRSVNGVVRAITAGESVQIRTRPKFGY